MERVAQEAKLIKLSNPELIKAVEEVASKAGVDPKDSRISNGGKEFLKIQDAEYNILQREHLAKLKKIRFDQINDRRNFDVYKNFKFGDFGVSEWDELGVIIPKKKNKIAGLNGIAGLEEFWCTVVVDLPKPPADDSKTKPIKESLIRFTMKSSKTPLFFNYRTFCQTIRLDYNDGKYVAMPQTEVVKAELLNLGLHNEKNEAETTNVLVNKTPY
ncbi:hypothetical protein Tco_0184482 [Tanacetum coccineum]